MRCACLPGICAGLEADTRSVTGLGPGTMGDLGPFRIMDTHRSCQLDHLGHIQRPTAKGLFSDGTLEIKLLTGPFSLLQRRIAS